MDKHTQTIRRLLATNCLSVFDHFVGLVLKGLSLFKLFKKIGEMSQSLLVFDVN